MKIQRLGVLAAATAIFVGACSSSGGGSTPAASAGAGGSASASDCTVGVSWNNFQQPRWAAHDKPNIQKTVEAAGGKYIDADANLSNEQQATDIDTMISKGAKVLIVLAQDTTAVLPEIKKAKDAGIPVIAYDRLIEDPSTLYITFDNIGVGKAEADAIIKKVPKGNYVLIKGDPGDPNAKTFLPAGWDQAGLKDKIASGDIKILNGPDGTFTDAWKTEKAQSNMEAIIDKAVADGTKIDAILAENDSTALGVVGALTGQELRLPAPQRPGRRHRQPEQPGPGQAVRGRLEERQRARQGRRCRSARAVRRWQPGFAQAAGRSHRPDGRSGRGPDRRSVHHAWRQHRQLVHAPADADHCGQPAAGHRRRPDQQGRPVQGRRRRHGAGSLQVAVIDR